MAKAQQQHMVEEIKFVSSVGTLGEERMIINIPKKYHKLVKALKEKDVIVIVKPLEI